MFIVSSPNSLINT